MAAAKAPETVDEYIDAFPSDVQAVLEKIRQTVRAAAPEAEERISYRMPSFVLEGVLIYFAAFKQHIGLYPPVRGDASLEKAVAPFAGEKGNLRFPLDRPIPYALITRIVKFRAKQNRAKAAMKRKRRKPASV